MLRQLAHIEARCENCGLQFGDDTIGLYLRCEAALSLLLAIRTLMPEDVRDARDPVAWLTLRQVAEIIETDVFTNVQPKREPAASIVNSREVKKRA
jgi:hypothetical protein